MIISKITNEELKKLAKIDPFNCSEYSGIKSCIGNNSGHSPETRDFTIAEGFKTCVDILSFTMANESTFYDMSNIYPLEDTLVYPFWFSCRHCIELQLKLSVKRIHWIWDKKGITPTPTQEAQYKKAVGSHKIKELSEIFKELIAIDEDTKNAFSEMKYFDDLVKDYYFDEDADVFRYTYKQNQVDVNLEGKGLINLSILYQKFLNLYQYFDWFCNYVFNNIYEDYKTATFTKNLNRNQIEEISKLLPPKDRWITDDFTEAKNNILSKFKISSKEFCNALDIIKKHREFSANIGVEIKYGDITDNTIKLLCDLIEVKKRVDAVPYLEKCYVGGGIMTSFPDESNYSKENYLIKQKIEKEFDDKGRELFSEAKVDEINLLLTFKEIGQVQGYRSEDIDMVFKRWQKTPVGDDYTLDKLSVGYRYVLKGLKMCGQKTYLKFFEKYLSN